MIYTLVFIISITLVKISRGKIIGLIIYYLIFINNYNNISKINSISLSNINYIVS